MLKSGASGEALPKQVHGQLQALVLCMLEVAHPLSMAGCRSVSDTPGRCTLPPGRIRRRRAALRIAHAWVTYRLIFQQF